MRPAAREQLTQQFQGMKVTVGDFVDIKTPMGTGRLLDYDFDLGKAHANGRILAVKTSAGVVLVTVTAGDAADADAIAQDVTSTISKLG